MSAVTHSFLSGYPWVKRLFWAIGIVSIGVGLGVWQPLSATLAPDVTFTTLTAQTLRLADLRGKPVLVTFWASDCASCVKEIPHLVGLYQRLHPRGLEIVAVAMYYDVPSHVVALRDAQQLPYPIVLDLKSEHARAFGHVQLTPTTFLIAPDGKVAEQVIGVFDPVAMQQHIETFL